ncbi:MAG: PIN domain-containing protein [Sphingomonadaceae bacterium]|nr:PIN domain-containing protein [Sphingomonadaceae bacterium]
MAVLLDTSVAVYVRDSDLFAARLEGLEARPLLSAVTRVELENGVYRDPAWAPVRRANLDAMLRHMASLDFGETEILAYRAIVAELGYSRRRVIDRMIAATAIANGLTLATLNPADIRDVPGLAFEAWPNPAAS